MYYTLSFTCQPEPLSYDYMILTWLVSIIIKAYIPNYYIIVISKAIKGFCFLGDERLSLCNYLFS